MKSEILEIRTDPRDPYSVTAVRIGSIGYAPNITTFSPPMTAEEARRAFDELTKHITPRIDLYRVLDIAKGKTRPAIEWKVKPRSRRK